MQPQKQIFLSRSLFIKFSKGSLQQKYTKIKQVGSGAYGKVYLSTLKQNPLKKRAIKQINKKSIKQPLTFINEIQILTKLDHPNIIKIYETFQDQTNYYIVTEFCEGGELFDKINVKGNFSESDARDLFKQMLYAIKYCHTQKVCHRDLKPENFLLLNEQSNSIKLIDFGLSFEWKQDMNKQLKQKKMNKKIGTSYYIAPQVIRGDYNEKCDIWSLGIILYILVSAAPPFDGMNDKQIMQAVKRGVYSFEIPAMKKVSNQLKDLIFCILQPQKTRISIDDIYKHPWMTAQLNKSHLRLNFAKMQNFSKYSKLKKFAITWIASQLPGKQIQKMGNLFKQIDVNNDGFITTKQLKSALDRQKQVKDIQQIQKMMKFVDTDHNGKLNYTEFIACCLENSVVFKEQNLVNAFRALDADGNGYITKQQLRKALSEQNKSLSSEVIQEILEVSDRNKDGLIDFKQFINSISQI